MLNYDFSDKYLLIFVLWCSCLSTLCSCVFKFRFHFLINLIWSSLCNVWLRNLLIFRIDTINLSISNILRIRTNHRKIWCRYIFKRIVWSIALQFICFIVLDSILIHIVHTWFYSVNLRVLSTNLFESFIFYLAWGQFGRGYSVI